MSRLHSLLEDVFDGQWQQAVEAASFRDVDGWDSLAYVRLVVAVEAEFGVELSAEEIERLPSYEGMRSVLATHGIEG